MEGKRVPSQQSSNSFMLNEEETQKISQLTSLKTQTKALTHEDIISGKFAIPMSKNKQNIYDHMKGSNKSNASKRISMDVIEKKALDKSPKDVKRDSLNNLKRVKENEQQAEEQQSQKEVKDADKENGKVRKSRISFDNWLVKAAEDKQKQKIRKRQSRMKEMQERLAKAKLQEEEAKRLKQQEEKNKIMELLRLKQQQQLQDKLQREEAKRKKEEQEEKERRRLEEKAKADEKIRQIQRQKQQQKQKQLERKRQALRQKQLQKQKQQQIEKQKQIEIEKKKQIEIEKQKEIQQKKRQAEIQKKKQVQKQKEQKQKQQKQKQKQLQIQKQKQRIKWQQKLKKQREQQQQLKQQQRIEQQMKQSSHYQHQQQQQNQQQNSPTKSPEQRRVKIVPESLEFHENDERNQNNFAMLSRMTCSTIRSTMESCVDYLGYVFTYYCKRNYSFNIKTTFSEISTKLQQMTISSFMIFCQDFKIRDQIARQKLIEIFKKHADFQKYLNIDQFHKVVEEISSEMYLSHKEQEMDEEQAKQEKQRNYKKTLKFLSLHNSHSFINKMNSLGSNARIKNSKGITVGNNPKYTFKLTPNNGRSEEQIQKEVQQRAILRKQAKDKNMQFHKQNKTNKIDALYENAQLRKHHKILNKTSKDPNDESQAIIYYDSNGLNSRQVSEMAVSQSKQTRGNSQNCKSSSGYYNPCEILNLKGDISYAEIFKLKRKISQINHRNKSDLSESKSKLSQSYATHSKDNEKFKLNKVISLARQNLVDQTEGRSFCASRQFCESQIVLHNSINSPNSSIGKIKKQLSPETNRKYLYSPQGSIVKNTIRKSIQLRQAEIMLNSQIKEIQIPIKNSQLRLQQKQFVRASEKVDKQNNYDLSKLEDVLGLKDGDEDEYLQKHYELERHFEGNSL